MEEEFDGIFWINSENICRNDHNAEKKKFQSLKKFEVYIDSVSNSIATILICKFLC